MSHAGEDLDRSVPAKEVALYDDAAARDFEWADLRSAVDWFRNNRVLVTAVLLIVAELAWKAQFLSHMYFRQDDFHDLDLAIQSPFSWRYVTFIGAGHLIIGLRIVAWFLVRTSLYNWGLASAITLAFVAAANVAALRLLRMLFGDRPAILVPLLVYAFCPLTVPDLGEWSSALESVPLQLALLMAVHAHICYVRTERRRHLVAAVGWVAFGLLFFEKGLIVPVLLLALTGGFLIAPRGNLLGDMKTALVRYWRAWLVYAALMAVYLVVLAQSLHTSTTHPATPGSASAVATFAQGLLKDSLVPGALGGPWQWLAVSGGSYSFAAPPFSLIWIGLLVAIAVVAASIWRRPIAWRAWVLVIGWVALADMLPVIISRLGDFSPGVLGTETRYVADAVPVLAIGLGLAFWPLTTDRSRAKDGGAHVLRARAAAVARGRRRSCRRHLVRLDLVGAGLRERDHGQAVRLVHRQRDGRDQAGAARYGRAERRRLRRHGRRAVRLVRAGVNGDRGLAARQVAVATAPCRDPRRSAHLRARRQALPGESAWRRQ